MKKLTRADLHTLEAYHELRSAMRTTVMAHKAVRNVFVGEHAGLYFEDRLTVQYQIQEMLRVERIFAAEAIEEELAAYNPLIPDGNNWKATFMLEYADADERRIALTQLRGVEDRVWVEVGAEKLFAIADEDLERENDSKTAAVHFLRFPFSPAQIAQLKETTSFAIGIDHDNYRAEARNLPLATRAALIADLD